MPPRKKAWKSPKKLSLPKERQHVAKRMCELGDITKKELKFYLYFLAKKVSKKEIPGIAKRWNRDAKELEKEIFRTHRKVNKIIQIARFGNI